MTVVDDRISDNEAACLQSLSDSVAAVETAEIRIGDSVAIFGQGSMGLECMQVARLSGAGTIITVDVRDEACAMSKQLGADSGINAMRDDPVAAIRDLTDGNGANVVFECAGGSPKQGLAGVRTLQQAVDSVRSGGKIVGVSWFGAPLEFDIDLLRERSLRYVFRTSALSSIFSTQSGSWPPDAFRSGRQSRMCSMASSRSRKHSRLPRIRASTKRSIPRR